jgi:hypothetical protein
MLYECKEDDESLRSLHISFNTETRGAAGGTMIIQDQ